MNQEAEPEVYYELDKVRKACPDTTSSLCVWDDDILAYVGVVLPHGSMITIPVSHLKMINNVTKPDSEERVPFSCAAVLRYVFWDMFDFEGSMLRGLEFKTLWHSDAEYCGKTLPLRELQEADHMNIVRILLLLYTFPSLKFEAVDENDRLTFAESKTVLGGRFHEAFQSMAKGLITWVHKSNHMGRAPFTAMYKLLRGRWEDRLADDYGSAESMLDCHHCHMLASYSTSWKSKIGTAADTTLWVAKNQNWFFNLLTQSTLGNSTKLPMKENPTVQLVIDRWDFSSKPNQSELSKPHTDHHVARAIVRYHNMWSANTLNLHDFTDLEHKEYTPSVPNENRVTPEGHELAIVHGFVASSVLAYGLETHVTNSGRTVDDPVMQLTFEDELDPLKWGVGGLALFKKRIELFKKPKRKKRKAAKASSPMKCHDATPEAYGWPDPPAATAPPPVTRTLFDSPGSPPRSEMDGKVPVIHVPETPPPTFEPEFDDEGHVTNAAESQATTPVGSSSSDFPPTPTDPARATAVEESYKQAMYMPVQLQKDSYNALFDRTKRVLDIHTQMMGEMQKLHAEMLAIHAESVATYEKYDELVDQSATHAVRTLKRRRLNEDAAAKKAQTERAIRMLQQMS